MQKRGQAREGESKRMTNSAQLWALSLIWSGSLGFNSMSQSGLETHTFVITFQEEGAGSVNSLGSSREAGQGSLLQQPALPSPSTARQALGCSLSRLITIYYPTDQSGDRGMLEEILGLCSALLSWLWAGRCTKGLEVASTKHHCHLGLDPN